MNEKRRYLLLWTWPETPENGVHSVHKVYAKSEKIEGNIMDSISFAEKRKNARKPHKQWPPDKRKTSQYARLSE